MNPLSPRTPAMIPVLMVSTSYPADISDWRGIFIRHLTEALSRRNDLRLKLWAPPGEMPANVTYEANAVERRWLGKLMATGGIAHLIRQGGGQALAAPVQLLLLLRAVYKRNSDTSLYHVNWLQSALPLPRNGLPVLVTVLGTDLQLLKLPMVRPLLRRVFRARRTMICPNADWMLPTLNDAFGDVAEVKYIPLGIAPSWFHVVRSPQLETKHWLAVTRITRGKMGDLLEWCATSFGTRSRELHLFGPMQEQIDLPSWVHYHGPASPGDLRDNWFPRAAGLITLSRHAEGRPQLMLEAMAAGLPILASNIPAHASFLVHDETGLLCSRAEDVLGLLERIEDPMHGARMGAAASAWVKREVGTWDDCADRYVSAYRELLGESSL